jgi:hypothetical protein
METEANAQKRFWPFLALVEAALPTAECLAEAGGFRSAQRNRVYDGLGGRSSKPERYGADDSRRKRALLAFPQRPS